MSTMSSVIFRVLVSITLLSTMVTCSNSKGLYASMFYAGINKKIVMKEELPPIGKLIITNLSIVWKNESNYEVLGCANELPCLELWICGGQRFNKFPERNVCDRIKFEEKWNPIVKELQLNFGEHWHLGDWHLDISGNTLVEEKINRKPLFETTHAYFNKNAKSGAFRYEAEDQKVRVTADLQIMCNADREGPNCVEKCDPSGANQGATWFCNELGRKECLSGWIGKECTVPYCEQGCQYGDCFGPNQCRCKSGFLGLQCNMSNYCTQHANPCMYDGICIGSVSDPMYYICDCPPGSAGRNCEVEVACIDGSCPLVPETRETDATSLSLLILVILVLFVVIFILMVVILYIVKKIIRNKQTHPISGSSSGGTSNSELDHLNGDVTSTVILIEGSDKPVGEAN